MTLRSQLVMAAAAACMLACGRPPKPAPNAPEPVKSADVATLVAVAERAFANSQRPDYRRPMQEVPPDRPPVAKLFLVACRAGDRRSCWMAMSLHDPRGIATEEVIKNCRAGHLLSCRALNPEVSIRHQLPGWGGKLRLCEPEDGCSTSLLQAECDAGHLRSCWELAKSRRPNGWEEHGPYYDPPAVKEPIVRQAREGCDAGIISECRILVLASESSDDQLLSLERRCAIDRHGCPFLGRRYQEMGEREKALYAFERACQVGTEQICDDVIDRYLDDRWPEPVLNRGRDLANWYCRHQGRCRLKTF